MSTIFTLSQPALNSDSLAARLKRIRSQQSATLTVEAKEFVESEKETVIKACDKNRFSIYVKNKFIDPDLYQALVSWVHWFQKRGIAAVISKNENGYAVYREDLIDTGIKE